VEERFPEGYARWLGGEIGHDGETREQLTSRVVSAVERIAAAHPAGTILVVTHGGAIRAIRRHADGDPGDPIENCGTSSIELVDGVLTGA
jgi:probable phosphoglycerate mutase